jgi:DNA helicase-2/ATP-dependent DNA helicase PcrA
MLTGLVQHPTPDSSRGGDPVGVAPEADADGDTPPPPPIVREEQQLLDVVLRRLDGGTKKTRIQVDDASALIELRDALAEAKPEDQGSILEQMHRIEALSKQRGKGDSPPVDRKSPYFGHLRLDEGGKRRDVLIGARSFVEPGSGVQIVDWRNAPVSRLFYRYEEGDAYEERLGDKMVEGEVVARRTVAIVDADLRRVAAPQGTFSRDLRTGQWREVATRQARLQIARDGSAVVVVPRG